MAKKKVKTTPCPACGEELQLKEHFIKPHRVAAYHDCQGYGMVAVYEAQAELGPVREFKSNDDLVEYFQPDKE